MKLTVIVSAPDFQEGLEVECTLGFDRNTVTLTAEQFQHLARTAACIAARIPVVEKKPVLRIVKEAP